jgi:hypothetical protein
LVAASTFNTALQQGQVTSNAEGLRAMMKMIPQTNGYRGVR